MSLVHLSVDKSRFEYMSKSHQVSTQILKQSVFELKLDEIWTVGGRKMLKYDPELVATALIF